MDDRLGDADGVEAGAEGEHRHTAGAPLTPGVTRLVLRVRQPLRYRRTRLGAHGASVRTCGVGFRPAGVSRRRVMQITLWSRATSAQ